MNREDIIRMAREAGYAIRNFDGEDEVMDGDNYHIQTDKIEQLVAIAVARERAEIERLKLLCEKMLRELYVYRASEYLKDTTAAIRARGEK